jgi:hypothetical protein
MVIRLWHFRTIALRVLHDEHPRKASTQPRSRNRVALQCKKSQKSPTLLHCRAHCHVAPQHALALLRNPFRMLFPRESGISSKPRPTSLHPSEMLWNLNFPANPKKRWTHGRIALARLALLQGSMHSLSIVTSPSWALTYPGTIIATRMRLHIDRMHDNLYNSRDVKFIA